MSDDQQKRLPDCAVGRVNMRHPSGNGDCIIGYRVPPEYTQDPGANIDMLNALEARAEAAEAKCDRLQGALTEMCSAVRAEMKTWRISTRLYDAWHFAASISAADQQGEREDATPDCATLLAGWISEMFCDSDGPPDIDGADLQEAMEQCGFVRSETYDPDKHGPQDFGTEPGKDLILILEPKAREARRRYSAFAAAKARRDTTP